MSPNVEHCVASTTRSAENAECKRCHGSVLAEGQRVFFSGITVQVRVHIGVQVDTQLVLDVLGPSQ